MSEPVYSRGYMAVLTEESVKKIKDINDTEESWKLFDEMYDVRIFIGLNDDVIYTDYCTDQYEAYGLAFEGEDLKVSDDGISGTAEHLQSLAREFGFDIILETARPYRCLWYNGGDSDMADMTKEEFLKRTKQECYQD